MKFLKLGEGKSGTREVAVAGLMFWAFITCWLFWWIPPEMVETYKGPWTDLMTTVWLFAGGAFGVTVAVKSGVLDRWRSPPQPRERDRMGPP